MAKALSVDLRRRVVDAINGGLSRRQAAERFNVSPSSAIRWHQHHRTTGALEASRDFRRLRIVRRSYCHEQDPEQIFT